jgi:hypothetical protein
MVAKKKSTKKSTRTTKSAPRRSTPKVSPLRGMPVSEWVERVSGWQNPAIKRLLTLCKKAAPAATVSIKWGQPIFEHNGPFAFVKAAKAHVTLGFWRGADLNWPAGLADGSGDRMRHLKITSLDEIDTALVTDLFKQALQLNKQKGDPTKRA